MADLEYDTRTLEVRRAGKLLQLNRTIRRILEFLLRQNGRMVTRQELEYLLWRDEVPDGDVLRAHMHALRSEEHTSELQSLMRISYAVFCLKKKSETPTYIT